jgi:DNA-binding response OmpR family regulator
MKTILAVSTDLEDYRRSTQAWGRHGYSVFRVDTMHEAITRLSHGEKFLFIGINEDNIDFWAQLPTMRKITDTPIYIITSTYNTEKKAKALRLGADGYDPFAENLEENVSGALALLEARSRAAVKNEKPVEAVTYNNIIVLPDNRDVFVGDSKVTLTKTEFDVLFYLMSNRGRVLSFEQIYSHVWGEEHDEAVNESVRTVIKRIRHKIDGQETEHSFIENVRGVGYRLPLKFDR